MAPSQHDRKLFTGTLNKNPNKTKQKRFRTVLILKQLLAAARFGQSYWSSPGSHPHPAGDVLWVFVEPGNVVP